MDMKTTNSFEKKRRLPAGGRIFFFVLCLLMAVKTVPVSEAADSNQAVAVSLEDGSYQTEVTLKGGSGRASVLSPCEILVREGKAYAILEWSSNHYDYMKMGNTTYYPLSSDGNSTFELPVTVFDSEITVIGDTTAMSVPHEVEYQLVFDGLEQEKTTTPEEIEKDGTFMWSDVLIIAGVVLLAFGARRGISYLREKKKK